MRIARYEITTTTFINIGGALVVAYLTVKLGQTIKHNYDLGRTISQENAQISLLQAQKDQLNYQLKYFATTSYQQREAHSELGLVVPGETEVVLPSPSVTPTPSTSASTSSTVTKSNWSQWIGFLTGKN